MKESLSNSELACRQVGVHSQLRHVSLALRKAMQETTWPTPGCRGSAHTDTAIIGTIARKCPSIDGAVVYKARALYQLLTGLAVQYKDDSCRYGAGGHSLFRVAPEDVTTGSPEQDYMLFPNPNEGVFSVRQAVPSDKLVEAKIYNALGQALHRETVHFINGVLNFRLENAAPGLYLVCITDEQHKVVCIKFNVK